MSSPAHAAHGPTTTHGPWGAGHPHLIVSQGGTHRIFPLDQDLVRIGSAPACELRLGGIDAVHAEVRHEEHDEYVLILHGPATTSTPLVPIESVQADGEVLRTGARFTLGPWALVFARDEFADHGRPYGGRQGGEGAHQQRQPPRPDYTGPHPVVP
ncbi:FHA domain-containing protein [Microbacterium candidum]|uniref:FHA domain-containing protein n=1 Tax=Microbacterium candidum TaxID=3041922 RepID=A0ABT7MWJ1_9MICO|nr:FHA domain-containing protein [Microbacterium sp. ASV49]MDL9978819.1 FHA domain-containing protein [Microbacterium sp. ASV49]